MINVKIVILHVHVRLVAGLVKYMKLLFPIELEALWYIVYIIAIYMTLCTGMKQFVVMTTPYHITAAA